MPSPLGHTLAGLAVHALAARRREDLWSLPRLGLTVGAAVAPDLDLLLRLVDGRNHHQMQTHSIGFAMIAAVAGALVARLAGWPRPAGMGAATGLAWLSHVVLDYLGEDTHPPIGLLALWPFSPGYFHFPHPIFLDIGRTLEWRTVVHDALAALVELALLAPMCFLAWRWRMRRTA
jgi:inner membrane protein